MIKIRHTGIIASVISCVIAVFILFLYNYPNFFSNNIPAFFQAPVTTTRGTDRLPRNENKTRNFLQTQNSKAEEFFSNEMTGIWVPYLDLSVNSAVNTEKIFKEKFQNIVSEAKKCSINSLIVHVRSHGDAMYPSAFFPWSHLLTGTQGVNPGFDPLAYMIKTAHENSLKFHAWINPLRIQTKTVPKKLSSDNPYFKLNSKKYFLNHADGICYNPAYAETKEIIIDGVKEIVRNYEVDGIHFDDYFYPEEKNLTSEDFAYKEYLKGGEGKPGLQEWRKNNINTFLKETYDAIKSVKPKVLFGISPGGNIKKCSEVGADAVLWASKKGYADYICPQIYWSIDYMKMPFEETAIEWRNIAKSSSVKLYCGLALYKAGTDLDSGTWKTKNDILASELKILKKLNYNGFILYSSNYLTNPSAKEEINSLLKEMESVETNK